MSCIAKPFNPCNLVDNKKQAGKQLGDKPSYLIATPSEHQVFYDSLFVNKLPYRPYPEKE